MRFWTWQEIREKVLRDLDLEDETFISPTELLGYANEAIDEAESEIHTLYEDYFLKRATVTLVASTEGYALPTDIYATKLRRVMYRNGATAFEIKRIKDNQKIERYTDSLAAGSVQSTHYEYFLENTTPGTPQMVLVPTPAESGAYITVWYLRNANRLSVDADVCDIPEFVQFVMQYMKVQCYTKEGHPNLPAAMAILEKLRVQMNGTLAQMTADGANEIEPDFTHYLEHN